MYFTPRGLEQATDEAIAAYKAARWARGGPTLDLCCGIGGDLLAAAARADSLLKRGTDPLRRAETCGENSNVERVSPQFQQASDVVGVDCDPIVALLADANLRAAGLHGRVRCARAEEIAVRDMNAWHLDPDRRPGRRRTTHVRWQQPPLEVVERLLAENPQAAIKLAPAAQPPEDWSDRAELEWISSRGECRQLVVWLGELALSPAKRRATVIPGKMPAGPEPRPTRSICGDPGVTSEIADVGRFVFEPDPAVRAADLVGALAAEHRLMAVARRGVYLTGEAPVEDAALSCFEVQEVLPFDVRKLKSLLRRRRIGRLEVKSRGVPLEPELIRRQLRVEGDDGATLLLCARESRVMAILARRVFAADPAGN